MLKRMSICFLIVGLLVLPRPIRADLFVLGGVWSGTFTTYNSSGALTNADSTPNRLAGQVRVNGQRSGRLLEKPLFLEDAILVQ
jgi:hypothetical protein